MADSQDEAKTYTQEEVDAVLAEKLAGVKAEDDPAFKKLWKEAKDAKAQARELAAKVTEMEHLTKAEKAGITSTELDRIRQEIRVDVEKSLAEQFADYPTLKAENRSLKLDNVVKAEMARNGVRPERIEALYRLSQDEFDLTEDGKPMVKSKLGTPVDKYITGDLLRMYPELFLGSGSSGGGATKSSGGAGGVRTISIADMTKGDNLAKVARGELVVAND